MTAKELLAKGFGRILAVWLVLVGAYAFAVWERIGELWTVAIVSVVGGTVAGLLLISIIGLITGGRDRAAIHRALSGEAPRDGQLEAASGPISAIYRPLEAPFTGQLCVAYEYTVVRRHRGPTEFVGAALAPSVIETIRGPARLPGWSLLNDFPITPDGRIDRVRGTHYLSSTASERLGVTGILPMFAELLSDDDGAIRKDFRHVDTVNLEGRRIRESSIPVGATVTILGQWSDARRGFVAAPPGMNQLFPGDLAVARRRLRKNAVTLFAIHVGFFVVFNAMLVVKFRLGQ